MQTINRLIAEFDKHLGMWGAIGFLLTFAGCAVWLITGVTLLTAITTIGGSSLFALTLVRRYQRAEARENWQGWPKQSRPVIKK